MPQATIDQDVMNRAFEVRGALAVEGLHRKVKLSDLLVAAAAERARLAVLHYGRDFDRIATITGQPTEWVAPSVTVDWGRAARRWVRHQGVDSRLATNLPLLGRTPSILRES